MTNRSILPARRHVGGALVASLALAASSLVGANLATAAPPTPGPVITIARVYTPTITVPNTPGAGAPYVVQDIAFNVDITTDVPLSDNKATPLVLTVVNGTDAGLTFPGSIAAGATSATFTGVVLPSPGNGVTITVGVDARKTDVTPGTTSFDVLKTSLVAPFDSTLTGFGGGGGPGVPCAPSAEDQICGDLVLPDSSGVRSPQLLGQSAGHSFLQVLVDVDPAIYNALNPILVVAKCDKTLCKGKGIRTYSVYVQISPNSEPVLSPACTTHGQIDSGDFCTDYVNSTRDNAGDLLLRVLLRIDAKIIYR